MLLRHLSYVPYFSVATGSEEDTKFVLDTTGDPALQEDFLPFGNEYDYTKDEDEGSISEVKE